MKQILISMHLAGALALMTTPSLALHWTAKMSPINRL